jgi:hypothetical protein
MLNGAAPPSDTDGLLHFSVIANMRERFMNRFRRLRSARRLDALQLSGHGVPHPQSPRLDLAARAWHPDANVAHQ